MTIVNSVESPLLSFYSIVSCFLAVLVSLGGGMYLYCRLIGVVGSRSYFGAYAKVESGKVLRPLMRESFVFHMPHRESTPRETGETRR